MVQHADIDHTGLTGVGGSLIIEDEGTPLATDATTLDFVGAGVTATGAGATKTITIPGGGGGGSHSYIGYNTVGGSTENAVSFKTYAKKVTIASAGFLQTIQAYIDWNNGSDSVGSLMAGVYSDSAGTPADLIHLTSQTATSLLLDDTSGGGGNAVARWHAVSCGLYLAAGDYWMAFMSVGTQPRFYYDATGSDRHYTAGGAWMADWGFYSPTTSANQYSIRGSFLEL
jgi:hypothetical protein